jgi:hypothetical protein
MAKVETIVFLSLVLDLFAFTIPLPLFPRLIEWYTLVSLISEKTHNDDPRLDEREKHQILRVSCRRL